MSDHDPIYITDILIRHIEPADLPQVHSIYAERTAFADTLQIPFQSIAHWERKLIAPRDNFICLVAVRGSEILGQLGLETFSSPRRRHVASIGMGVKATVRRTGIGSALLTAAIDTCEKWMNISRIEIEVYTDNDAAIALYKRHGFVIEGTCRNYAFRDGQYVNAYVMARVIY